MTFYKKNTHLILSEISFENMYPTTRFLSKNLNKGNGNTEFNKYHVLNFLYQYKCVLFEFSVSIVHLKNWLMFSWMIYETVCITNKLRHVHIKFNARSLNKNSFASYLEKCYSFICYFKKLTNSNIFNG
jgi:hypothetical protein